MEPYYEFVPRMQENSFFIKRDTCVSIDSPWHYHPEFELTIIEKSEGKRFVGLSIENFKEGDMVFLGSNLPHAYSGNPEFRMLDKKYESQAFVMQFDKGIFGDNFFDLPECAKILSLFNRAAYGIKFFGKIIEEATGLMERLMNSDEFERIIILMQILNLLSNSQDYYLLNTKQSNMIYQSTDSVRFNKIYKYLTGHFKEDICIEKIAGVAGLSKTAFCRYFKARTGLSFIDFLHKMRIEYACTLLKNSDSNINQVASEAGYSNISNFNRWFKRIYGKSPREIKEEYSADELRKKVSALDLR